MSLNLPPGGVLLGLGVDVIEVSRVRGVLERQGERFLERVFTEEEREYCFRMAHPHKHLAARFAAKEAVSSASRRASAPSSAGGRCRSTTASATSPT
jgi:holo-[acyl-carrier protein] synthase